MSVGATLAATGLGLAMLGWLTTTDPKRRRAFARPPANWPAPKAAWVVVALTGALATYWSGPAGFVLWLGGTTAVGWALIALPPDRGLEAALPWIERHIGRAVDAARPRIAAVRQRLGRGSSWRQWLAHARPGAARPLSDRALAARIAALEAELAALRAELDQRREESDAVLLDLAGRRRQALER